VWSVLLVWVGQGLGSRWTQIRDQLKPFDTLILVLVVLAAVLFVWWRLGMPGRRRRSSP
jgi:membrane protein DedA with SNARE-associated domain